LKWLRVASLLPIFANSMVTEVPSSSLLLDGMEKAAK
jgi:hypothetical protein